jgi:hypothetical protein
MRSPSSAHLFKTASQCEPHDALPGFDLTCTFWTNGGVTTSVAAVLADLWKWLTVVMNISWVGSINLEQVLFGAKLKIACKNVSGNKDETPDNVFVKFRVENSTQRHVAKNCRAYLVELHKISNTMVISQNLIPDTFQLPWPNDDFEPRDTPAKVKHYVDLVRFSKHAPGWKFMTKPGLYSSLATLANHIGTYRFTVVVAADDAKPQTAKICVDYNGDWHNVTPPYDSPT